MLLKDVGILCHQLLRMFLLKIYYEVKLAALVCFEATFPGPAYSLILLSSTFHTKYSSWTNITEYYLPIITFYVSSNKHF